MTEDKMSSNSVEAEYMNIANKNEWLKVYKKIGAECVTYPCTEAKKSQNKHLNRYRDVNPYDHSRIVLERISKDYINANLVEMKEANRRYILTQGPLIATVNHFWLMVWEQKSRAILMLNKIIEKNEVKCHWYWPQGIGEEYKMILNNVNLSVEQISEEDFSYYSTRLFRITDLDSNESREVIHFHYTTWPDFGVPTSPVAFLDFLKKVRSSGALEPDVGPAIVHCSAGIGRSGTFCLVDSCLVISEKQGLACLNVQEKLLELRKYRMGLIQTPDQLRFSYQAIIEGVKRFSPNWNEDHMEESIYSAVAEDGEEESPPPLPPRSESLGTAPARPLPAIPASASMGALPSYPRDEVSSSEEEHTTPNASYMSQQGDESGSEEEPPSPPARNISQNKSCTDKEDIELTAVKSLKTGEVESVRQRRNRELAERITNMKKRSRDASRWHAFKRSLCKPLTISFGFLLAGILLYSYTKH